MLLFICQKKTLLDLLYFICILLACMYVHHMCALPAEIKKALGPLGLDLQRVLSQESNMGPLQNEQVFSWPHHLSSAVPTSYYGQGPVAFYAYFVKECPHCSPGRLCLLHSHTLTRDPASHSSIFNSKCGGTASPQQWECSISTIGSIMPNYCLVMSTITHSRCSETISWIGCQQYSLAAYLSDLENFQNTYNIGFSFPKICSRDWRHLLTNALQQKELFPGDGEVAREFPAHAALSEDLRSFPASMLVHLQLPLQVI